MHPPGGVACRVAQDVLPNLKHVWCKLLQYYVAQLELRTETWATAPPAPQAEGSLENTRMMADLARRAAVLWLDLRAAAAADRPTPDERAALAAYNAAHLGFVRKDPDNSARRRAGLVPGLRVCGATALCFSWRPVLSTHRRCMSHAGSHTSHQASHFMPSSALCGGAATRHVQRHGAGGPRAGHPQ
jgi:hypothetical protein